MTYVKIRPASILDEDQSARPALNSLATVGPVKTFEKDGQSYILHPNEAKNVPEGVALAWNSHDPDVQILWDGFNL